VIRRLGSAAFALAIAATPLAAPLAAQERSYPAVGQAAPDFALAAATRKGVRLNPVRLGDYRGKTVVLAFFYKARTKG
jgi:peroxiredoxin Q/BCP